LCLAGLLVLGCGGDAGSNGDGPDDSTSVAGASMTEAGSAGQTGAAAGSMAAAGQGGSLQPAGGAGGTGEITTAGESGSSGGKSSGGANSGGASAGGGAGGSAGSAAGASSGGSGGKASDLEPKPAAGCPGFVDILVPHGTCVWIHGAKFTTQNQECDVVSPMEKSCSTASAVSKDITVRVSTGAPFERFDFDATGCPQSCN
jgi:hypothetical protein